MPSGGVARSVTARRGDAPFRERLAIRPFLLSRGFFLFISQVLRDLLRDRRARVAKGEARLMDWDSVKFAIGK